MPSSFFCEDLPKFPSMQGEMRMSWRWDIRSKSSWDVLMIHESLGASLISQIYAIIEYTWLGVKNKM